MKFKSKKVISLITASSVFWTVSAGFVKNTVDVVHAAISSSIKNGDADKNNIVDVFDLIYVREAVANGTNPMGLNILNENYCWELQQYLLCMSDEFTSEKVMDSDEDGLSDWDEVNIYGTDPNNPDTDEDGFPDGYEVYTLGTDPLTTDTIGNDDFDNDGLTNAQEFEYGTDPFSEDTDEDGISDYDEIFIYGTDPLNPDSDGDGISDSDEMKLELDPNNPTTKGYPDNQYISTQIISADHEILSEINTVDNPYKLSIEITAAGLAESNLEVTHSGYSYAMCNSISLGAAPELIYNENLTVQSVTLKFEINHDYINNIIRPEDEKPEDAIGIKRLNVFKYFESIDMLLPVETKYDVQNNIVYICYATIDR